MPATVGFQAISPEEEVAPGKHSKFMAGVLGKGFTINYEMFFFNFIHVNTLLSSYRGKKSCCKF